MAVGASQPTVVASKDGRIGMKTQMQVFVSICFFLLSFHNVSSVMKEISCGKKK